MNTLLTGKRLQTRLLCRHYQGPAGLMFELVYISAEIWAARFLKTKLIYEI